MMQITTYCPGCDTLIRESFETGLATLKCRSCGAEIKVAPASLEGNNVVRCLVCPSTELFVRKDFPQRLGVAIVVLGFSLSSVAWYHHMILSSFAVLFVTALIDVCLYLFMGDLLECYRCHAQYRGVGNLENEDSFDLEVHEKHRQQTARLKQARSPD